MAKLPARLVVANYSGSSTTGSIGTFAYTSKGDAAPQALLAGSATGIIHPTSVAVDSSGDIVAMYNEGEEGGESVAVFGPGATGNAKPLRIITDTERKHRIYYVGIDGSGYVYGFFEEGDHAFGVDVFAPGASGKTTPARTLKGPDTYLQQVLDPTEFYVGAKGDMWVVTSGNFGPAFVLEFAPGAKNDDRPVGQLAIQAKDDPSFAVNEDGALYLSQNAGSSWVTQVYPNISASSAPFATYTLDCGETCTAAAATGTQVVFRTKGGVSPSAVLTYNLSGPSGTLHPLRTLEGMRTELDNPFGAAVR